MPSRTRSIQDDATGLQLDYHDGGSSKASSSPMCSRTKGLWQEYRLFGAPLDKECLYREDDHAAQHANFPPHRSAGALKPANAEIYISIAFSAKPKRPKL